MDKKQYADPARGQEVAPLSFAQERMWFLEQLEGPSALYNIPMALRLAGALDTAALQRTVDAVVARHASLRTTFRMGNGKPEQAIAQRLELPLVPLDLGLLDADAREARARELARQEAQLPFDLQRGPLLRAKLLRLDAHDHMLLFTVHHIVADAWSLGVLVREVAALYAAQLRGEPAALPPLSIQYADYARWQRQWLGGARLQRQLDYWKEQLRDAPALLELATDRPRPAVRGRGGATVDFTVDAQVTDGLRAVASASRATLFMVLVAAFDVLLWRHSGQPDICIGTPVANRSRAELEPLIGLFVNTLVLRTRLRGDEPFTGLLQRVRATAVEAYAHQGLPFEQLVEALKPQRHTSHASLFQVMLVLQNAPTETLALPGLDLRPCDAATGTAKFDLTLNLTETRGRLHATLGYATDLFDASTARRMAQQFQWLLQQVAARPRTPVGALELEAPQERQLLLREWSAARQRYAGGPTLPALFEAQAQRGPGRTALVFEGRQLSYGELNARANRLARHLRGQGVGPDSLVGLCVERGIDMVVGLLAILKAGGAYLPLDPAYPKERLAFMLQDARPAMVVTHDALRALAGHAAPVFCLDTQWRELEHQLPYDLPPLARPGHLAYVIYTSGSTGRPKGVGVTHHNVCRLFQATGGFGFDARDVWCAFHSFAFDFSVWEIWGALLHGGTLVLVPFQVSRSPGQFLALLRDERVTVLNQTPSAFQALANADLRDGCTVPLRLRQVILGGEAVDRLSVDPWRAARPDVALTNMYGITETTVHVTWTGPAPDAFRASIGRPIDDLDVYILDARLAPVPVGVVGELYVGGDGLARGYVGQAALTAERFVPDPHGPRGGRMYRSGDLARWRPDGSIAFAGRADQQVKIRGFRIEPGEVEAALVACAGVREALVIAREDQPGDRRLVAYVAGEAGAPPQPAQLRARLQESLPDHMVPAHVMVLPQLPLTPNGKVDRARLPAPLPSRGEQGYEAPRTQLEHAVAAVWAEVLGLDRVGVHDNFFELGGHSLLAVRAVDMLRERLALDVQLVTLMRCATPAAFAEAVGDPQEAPRRADRAPIVPSPGDDGRPFPVTDLQRAYLAGRDDEVALGAVGAHAYAEFELPGVDPRRVEAVLSLLIARHGMLRAVFDENGTQRILAQVPAYRLEQLDLGALPEREADARFAALRRHLSHRVFRPDTWPLFDVRLTTLPGARQVFHLSAEALVADATSIEILRREFAVLYTDPGASLPALDLSFRDYVLARADTPPPAERASALAYWLGQFDGPAYPPQLPMHDAPAARGAAAFSRRRHALSAAETAQLKDLAQAAGVSVAAFVLTAFIEVLEHWSRSDGFTLNVTLFDRQPLHPRVHELVGNLTTVMLLKTVAGPEPFEARARRVQEQLLGGLDHAHVSGIAVARELARRFGSREQLFPVVFTSMLGLQAPLPAGALPLDSPSYAITQTPQVWLDHQLREHDGQLVLTWDARDGCVDDAVLDQMFAAHCDRLARRCAAGSCALPPLAAGADPQPVHAPLEGLLHGAFDAHARERPSAVALVCGGQEIPYGVLRSSALRLAQRLRAHGAGRGQPVAVCTRKDWRQVLGALAALYAGAAYLPLDPDWPPERIRAILRDARPRAVLVDDSTAPLAGTDQATVQVGLDDPAQARAAPDAPASPAPDDLAYVIYTSGSTGQPKGVMIQHGAAANTLRDLCRRYALGASDAVLAVSAFTFDLSVFDVFGMLSAGGRVVLPQPQEALSPPAWRALLERHRVTVWNSVPALMQLLVEGRSAGLEAASLRLVLLSGDWVPIPLVRQLKQLLPAARLVSLGGATEASIWSIFHEIGELDPAWKSIPYGKALDHQSVFVLDRQLRPRPRQVVGEIHIGGAGLAAGYWNDEARSRASFITHPRTGARLYATGDLGRTMADGSIEFLGREDHQVKVNGQRIELGEIEAAMAAHPGVNAAVVLCQRNDGGAAFLVAFAAVGKSPAGPDMAAALKRFLEDRLPRHMVPARIQVTDALPLSANGKLDRAALAGIARSLLPAAQPTAAGNAGEHAILALVRELLQRDSLGEEQDLFAAGVTSLDLIRISNALSEAFGFEPALMRFFDNPTVAELLAMYREHLAQRA